MMLQLGNSMSHEQSSQNVIDDKIETISNDSPSLIQKDNIDSSPKSNIIPLEKESCGCGCMNKEMELGQKMYIYAIGRIRPVFRSLAVEKEYAQVMGQASTSGLTDMQALKDTLLKKENRYLVRQICWVLNIEGLDAYVLHPVDLDDLHQFVNAFHPPTVPTDVNVIIGYSGPISNPQLCGGITLPICVVTNLYSFDVDSLIKSLPRPKNVEEKKFRESAREVFYRILQLADNFGSTDEHRALNYLAVRYSAIYANTAEMFLNEISLSRVEVVPSRLSLTRKVVDVIFSYVERKTDVTSKFFVRVDVTEEFPFLVTRLTPYFDR
jgi:PatG C-terminal